MADLAGPGADGGTTAPGPGPSMPGPSMPDLSCQHGGSLVAALKRTSIPLGAAASGRAVLSARPGGLAVAFPLGGAVHVVTLDADDQPTAAVPAGDVTVAASDVFGLASSGTDHALLVSRPPDYMSFVRVSTGGAPLAQQDLVGGGDHAVVGSEWFGDFARTGRLVATAGGYAAYFALHRRWPDMIAHQGDTLRLLDAAGADQGGGWGWGCSHSMDQRLGASGAQLGAFCISDCYPVKAINYNWMGGVISDEPAGNCAGSVDASLGGAAPASGGIWFTYVSGNARPTHDIGIVKVDPSGKRSQQAFLTSDADVESNVHLAAFDGGLLLTYEASGSTWLQRLDGATGQPVGAREAAPMLSLDPGSDLITDVDGDAVGAFLDGGALVVVRVRACVP